MAARVVSKMDAKRKSNFTKEKGMISIARSYRYQRASNDIRNLTTDVIVRRYQIHAFIGARISANSAA